MVKWLVAAVLLLPAAEIAAFILVAAIIGLVWALATALAGYLVLRRAGRGLMAHFRSDHGGHSASDLAPAEWEQVPIANFRTNPRSSAAAERSLPHRPFLSRAERRVSHTAGCKGVVVVSPKESPS